MADWSWSIGPGASSPTPEPVAELASATGRTVTRRRRAASTAQFTLDGRSAEAIQIVDKVSDLWVWRNGVQMFRGRVVIPNDTVPATGHVASYTATDYRGMLAYRTVGDTDVELNDDQAAMVWSLIAASQARTGGNWGVTLGVIPDGTPRVRNFPAGKSLAEAIAEIADAEGGFDWEIDPELRLNIWSPTRGRLDPVTLDHGGLIAEVGVTGTTQGFGNVLLAFGSDQTTPVVAEDPGLVSDPRGRWELVDASPTVELQATLTERAPQRLAVALADASTVWARYAPGRWTGPDDLWLGDRVALVVNSGRLGVYSLEVEEITLVPGDDGSETITVGLTPSSRTTGREMLRAQQNDLKRRIRALELAVAHAAP